MKTEKGKNESNQNDNQGSLHGGCDISARFRKRKKRKKIVDLLAEGFSMGNILGESQRALKKELSCFLLQYFVSKFMTT